MEILVAYKSARLLLLADRYSMTRRLPVGTVKKVASPVWVSSVLTPTCTCLWKGWRAAASASRVGRAWSGVLAMLTLGVPLMPTFQAPLCWAEMGPLTAAVTLPVTGSGVLITLTF